MRDSICEGMIERSRAGPVNLLIGRLSEGYCEKGEYKTSYSRDDDLPALFGV